MIYASSIQQAIITSEEYINNMFREFLSITNRVILFRAILLGTSNCRWQKLIAVGDCTGHGVPGAMMSILGSAFLNEICD
ncbi:MAG: hypothetical protein IPG07_17770 [Crocinitomicaceae bacterium]|nr:hypothetical protein [Crocinitomicaceae bacterium]